MQWPAGCAARLLRNPRTPTARSILHRQLAHRRFNGTADVQEVHVRMDIQMR